MKDLVSFARGLRLATNGSLHPKPGNVQIRRRSTHYPKSMIFGIRFNRNRSCCSPANDRAVSTDDERADGWTAAVSLKALPRIDALVLRV